VILRFHRSRRRAKNYNGPTGDSGANLAGTTAASPEGDTSGVTQRRGIIPSTAFFTDRLSAAQRQQYNASPNRSSSPTLGNDGSSKNGGRRAMGAFAGGAAGLAAMEGARHSGFQRDFTTSSPIPEHPPQLGHPRDDDAISVSSLYREDWPGPQSAAIDPLFHDEFPQRARTASPNIGRALSPETHGFSTRPASNISIWPGPGAPNSYDRPGTGNQNPTQHLATQHEDEVPETIRPSPARTPQIHSSEINSYPFPERQASPHTGFSSSAFQARRPSPSPFSDRHGI
jgi:hypothetical protein